MNLSANERIASIAAGMTILEVGRGFSSMRTLSRVLGLALLARGAAGYCPVVALGDSEQALADTQAALSGPRGVHVRAAVTIARPRAELFRAWRDLTALPGLLPHIQQIDRQSDSRSVWTAVGESGMPVQWTAELVNEIENELVAWRSTGSHLVVHAGSVRFRDALSGTEVLVHLQYRPAAGTLGRIVARVLGHDPGTYVQDDLRRMKQQLETGELATAGASSPSRQERASRGHRTEASQPEVAKS